MVGVMADITERKKAEQSLRESEERFRLVANTAPVMIYMCGTDKLCNYFNQPWLEFTGRSLEADIGNGWTEVVHPEDLTTLLDIYTQAFDRRERFEMEYRLRRHDGEYRWVSDIGVPRFNPDGSFAGYIGSCMDVTDRKLADEALTSMSRKLIEAHEEERTWIARELHDDINQRIALMAIELDRWNQTSRVGGGYPRLMSRTSANASQKSGRTFSLYRTGFTPPSSSIWVLRSRLRASARSYPSSTKYRSTSAIPIYRITCRRKPHFACSESYRRRCRMRRNIAVVSTSKWNSGVRQRRSNYL